ncbi:hypothetical protein PYCC9005_004146 [Savitreella phatthalungensis]
MATMRSTKQTGAHTHDQEVIDPLSTPRTSFNSDEQQLQRLGYKPVLHRSFQLIDNFSAAFAAMYFVGGIRVTYFLGIGAGGPLAYWTSYLVTCVFTFITAGMLAEICSALPAAGSLYFWAAEAAGPRYGRLTGFIVAWWTTTAWTTFTASVSQSAANYMLAEISVFDLSFTTDTTDVKFRAVQWICAEALLAVAMGIQYLPPKTYKYVFRVASAVVLLDFILNIIWFPIAVSKTYGFRSAHDAFLTQYNGTGASTGWDWCLSFLSTAGILVGYDASGHVAEETKHASRNAARGLWWSAFWSAVLGIPIVILFLFCAPDIDTFLSFVSPQPFVNVYALALGQGGHILMNIICIVGLVLNCSVASVAASRLVFAVARDGVLPFSDWIARVDHHGNPRNAITVIWLVSSLLLLTILPSAVAFTSLVSAAGVPTFAAYGVVALGRAFLTPGEFTDGAWRLGFLSRPLIFLSIPFNWFAVAVLVSPYVFPVTAQTLNYAGIILGAITIFGFISWLVVPEHRWLEKRRLLAVRQAQSSNLATTDSSSDLTPK